MKTLFRPSALRNYLMLGLSVSLFPGCASIINGKRQMIGIAPHPLGAVASVDGKKITTPAVVSLKRKATHTVTFQTPDYESEKITIYKTESGAVWGNVFLGGLIGIAVDYGTGAAYNLNPGIVRAELRPMQTLKKPVQSLVDPYLCTQSTTVIQMGKIPQYSYVEITIENGKKESGFIMEIRRTYNDKLKMFMPYCWTIRCSETNTKTVNFSDIKTVTAYPLVVETID